MPAARRDYLMWLTRCFRGRDISPLFHSTPADNVVNFFTNKISTIYHALSVIPLGSTQPSNDMTDMHTEEMASLAVITEDEVRKIILVGPSKICLFDPVPISMVKDC